MLGTKAKGTRYLEMTEGYVTRMALDEENQVIGYEFIHLGKMMDAIKKGVEPAQAMEDDQRPLRPLRTKQLRISIREKNKEAHHGIV